MGDENCGGELDLSHPPPPIVLIPHPRTSQLTVSVWGGGGVRGMGCHAPTPQAGRVTDSDKGGRVRAGGKVVPCPHGSGEVKLYIDYESLSDNKRCRRMGGIKLSAVGECAE
jgi:hypothetical protein